jgi:hypothetical protein
MKEASPAITRSLSLIIRIQTTKASAIYHKALATYHRTSRNKLPLRDS